MGFWIWILQVIVLLVAWKLVHLFFWNMRKMLGSQSLVLSMLITLVIAVAGVLVSHIWHTDWSEVIVLGALLGVANGEYEYNRGTTKS